MLVTLVVAAFVIGLAVGVAWQRWSARRVRVPNHVPAEWTRAWLEDHDAALEPRRSRAPEPPAEA